MPGSMRPQADVTVVMLDTIVAGDTAFVIATKRTWGYNSGKPGE